MTIRNPVEWVADQVSATVHTLEDAGHELQHPGEGMEAVEPEVRSITVRDLKEVLTKGFSDFGEYRTDIFFIGRSEEHTSELQSLMRISYAVFCLKKKTN